jgi:hypothetical protein
VLFLVHRFLSPWWRRRQVPPKRRFLQEPHGVTTQKTPFFLYRDAFLKTSRKAKLTSPRGVFFRGIESCRISGESHYFKVCLFIFLYRTISYLVISRLYLPIQWARQALSPKAKRPGRGVDHSSPTNTETKNTCGLYICIPQHPHGLVLVQRITHPPPAVNAFLPVI